MSAARQDVLVAHTRLSGFGYTAELAFPVSRGVDRIDVRAVASAPPPSASGCSTRAAPAYQSPAFRGVYGNERHGFWVATRDAAPGFLPGPITAVSGRWCSRCSAACRPPDVEVTVRLRHGPVVAPLTPAPVPELVRDHPGWYREDLHVHSTASSDAFATGSALAPEAWGEECRRAGLDLLTDHNVVAQNRALAGAARSAPPCAAAPACACC